MTHEDECRARIEHYRALARGQTDAIVLEVLRRMIDEWVERLKAVESREGRGRPG